MPDRKPLEHPNKVTLKWLWENVGYKFWLSLLSLFIATFLAGVSFSGSALYNSLFDSSDLLVNNRQSNNKKPINSTNENPYNATNSSSSYYQQLNNKHTYIEFKQYDLSSHNQLRQLLKEVNDNKIDYPNRWIQISLIQDYLDSGDLKMAYFSANQLKEKQDTLSQIKKD